MDQDRYIPDSPYLTDNLNDHPEELSLLLQISAPRSFAPGQLIYVQGEESKHFFYLIEKHPRVSLLIISAFARVTRMLVLQIEDFSFLDAEKRVAHMLYKLAHEVGEKTSKGLLIAKKVTQEDIASLTELSRVSVSLAMNHFANLAILRKKRNVIEIFDMEKLRDFVDDI